MLSSSVNQLAAEALAQRRSAWSPYHAVVDLEALEALQGTVSDTTQRETLDAYIVRRRRSMKGVFETLERRGETRERLAFAAAVALALTAQWLGRVPSALSQADRIAVEAMFYVSAVVAWTYWFTHGRQAIATARRLLAELGKAE